MQYDKLTIKSENRKLVSIEIFKDSLKKLLNQRGKLKTKIAEHLKKNKKTTHYNTILREIIALK